MATPLNRLGQAFGVLASNALDRLKQTQQQVQTTPIQQPTVQSVQPNPSYSPTSLSQTTRPSQQPAPDPARQWYEQLLNAKRGADTAPDINAERVFWDQSNEARRQLQALGHDVSTGAWASGTSFQEALNAYRQMYGIDPQSQLDQARQYFEQILDAKRIWDNSAPGSAARKQATDMSNEARRILTNMGFDVTSGGWASGTSYAEALEEFNKLYQQQIDDQVKQEVNLVDELAKKYGFDYSREYAQRQAEIRAQQQRDAIEAQRRAIENQIMSATEALDRDYFQRYMQQAQQLTEAGLNAGIAADQNLRLAMARQASLGDVYRDANLQRFALGQEEARVEQERLAYEEQLYNERLRQAFDQIQQERAFRLEEGALTGSYVPEGVNREAVMNLAEEVIRQKEAYARATTDAERVLANLRANEARAQLRRMGVDPSIIDANVTLDQARANISQLFSTADFRLRQQQLRQETEQFKETMKLRWEELRQQDRQFLQRLGWEREQWNTLSAADRERFALAREELEEQKRRFNTEQEWREYTYNNMSAAEKAQFDESVRRFGIEQAWREWEFEQTHKLARDRFNFEIGLSGSNPYDSGNYLE